MDPSIKLNEEKMELHEKLSVVLEANQKLNAEAKALTEKLSAFEKAVGSPENAIEIMEGLRKYLELEPFKSYAISAGLLSQDSLQPAQIINKMRGLAESYSALGTVAELTALKEAQAEFAPLGTSEELSTVLDIVEKYNELGTIEEMDRVLDLLEEFMAIGTPAAIRAQLQTANKFADDVMETKRKLAAKKISAKLGVNESVAFEMVKSMGVKATIEALSTLQESVQVTNRYRVSDANKITEDAPLGRAVHKTAGYAGNFFDAIPAPVTVVDHRN
jgi:hypothetical protein